jgi:predicted nucleic acid-binding protein
VIVAGHSVLVSFWLPGAFTRLAEAAKARDDVWAAPVLWRAEFRSVLAACLRQGLLTETEANAAFLNAQKDLGEHEYSVPTEHILKLVAASHCAAGECEYVALAQDLGVPLVTTDPQVIREFPKIAVSLENFAKKRK